MGIGVTVLERGACCKETSDNSLRIIHGGFRYLQTLDFGRLRQSLADQTAILRDHPDLVTPFHCYMALSGRGLKSRWPIEAASRLYGLFMAKDGSPLERPRFAPQEEVNQSVPALRGLARNGCLVWSDGLLSSPAQLGVRLGQAASSAGAEILEQHEVTSIAESSGGFFTVETKEGGAFHSRIVINAAGPWVREIPISFAADLPKTRWCKGFNVVVKKQFDPSRGVGFESSDGRLFFVVPRGDGSVIGTGYLPVEDIRTPVEITGDEIDPFLRSFNLSAPQFPCAREDVIGIDAGYLPMRRETSKGPELFGSEILTANRGYIEVLSTKYTTYRSQAQKVCVMVTDYLEGRSV